MKSASGGGNERDGAAAPGQPFADIGAQTAFGLLHALRNTAVSVVYQHPDLRVIWAQNVPSAWSCESIVGKSDRDFLPPDIAATVAAAKRAVLSRAEPERLEICIPGIPGDIFLEQMKNDHSVNKIRLAKEFVKFNERCFVRLLGDMRSYNFVIDITPDIEDYQYRIRAIDFDQQSYEGKKNLYLPQFFKENNEFVELSLKHLNKESIEQYQTEERTLIAFRLATSKYKVKQLLDIMKKDTLSTPEKTEQLIKELAEYHQKPSILKCQSIGELLRIHMKQMLRKSLKLIPKLDSRR